MSDATPGQTDPVNDSLQLLQRSALENGGRLRSQPDVGMTDADMIERSRPMYGPPWRRSRKTAASLSHTRTGIRDAARDSETPVRGRALSIVVCVGIPADRDVAATRCARTHRRRTGPPRWTSVKRPSAKSRGRRKRPQTLARPRKNRDSRTRRLFDRESCARRWHRADLTPGSPTMRIVYEDLKTHKFALIRLPKEYATATSCRSGSSSDGSSYCLKDIHTGLNCGPPFCRWFCGPLSASACSPRWL